MMLTGIPSQAMQVPLQTCPTGKVVQSTLLVHAVVYVDAGMSTHAPASAVPTPVKAHVPPKHRGGGAGGHEHTVVPGGKTAMSFCHAARPATLMGVLPLQ